jgi:REP element-mobilizing transposase RayT
MSTNQPDNSNEPRGWHSRGYLPHFDGGEWLPQSVTFRLADSVPPAVIEQWTDELTLRPTAEREAELRKLVESFLDTGDGACQLGDPRIGSLVETALLYFDGERYRMHAWAVMPNYVHALLTPARGRTLSDIVGSWKSFTSKEANRVLGRTGQFWREEYFDRFIRNCEHYINAFNYIENNPVKAGLCAQPSDWPFGSARRRLLAQAAETAAPPGTAGILPADSRVVPLGGSSRGNTIWAAAAETAAVPGEDKRNP